MNLIELSNAHASDVIADARHRKRIREWERECRRERNELRRRLRDPVFCEARGLPPVLPDESIKILSETMMMSKMGPRMPKRSRSG